MRKFWEFARELLSTLHHIAESLDRIAHDQARIATNHEKTVRLQFSQFHRRCFECQKSGNKDAIYYQVDSPTCPICNAPNPVYKLVP